MIDNMLALMRLVFAISAALHAGAIVCLYASFWKPEATSLALV